MEPNHDLLDLMIAARQQSVQDGITQANRSHPLSFARRTAGRALIAAGERIRGEERNTGAARSASDHVIRTARLSGGYR